MDWTRAFATAETTKLFLDEAKQFWIEARNELTNAEQRAIGLASVRSYTKAENLDDGTLEVDLGAGADRKVLTYLVDWNLPGADGKTIEISNERLKRDAVRNLSPAHYRAIEEAIDRHVFARLGEKKLPSGSSGASMPATI